MSKFICGLIYWWAFWIGTAFLVAELLAHFWNGCPWPTFSRTTWDIEDAWEPFRVALVAFTAVLCLHLVFRLSVIPMLIVVGATALAVVLHFTHIAR